MTTPYDKPKHCAGNGYVCADCEKIVDCVYADTVEDARAGKGFCEDCYRTNHDPAAEKHEQDRLDGK